MVKIDLPQVKNIFGKKTWKARKSWRNQKMYKCKNERTFSDEKSGVNPQEKCCACSDHVSFGQSVY